MSQQPLQEQGSFIVGESVGLTLIAGGVLSIVCIGAIISFFTTGQTSELYLGLVLGLFAVPFLKKGIQNRTSIKINSNGFFYYGKHLFRWESFQRAKVVQDEVFGSFQDHFYLVLEFQKPEGLYRRRIALTNTQNKSEEEIIAAIRFYNGRYKAAAGA